MEQQASKSKLTWVNFLKFVLAILFAGVTFFSQMVGMIASQKFSSEPMMQLAIGEGIAAVFALVFVLILGGYRWCIPKRDSISYVFKLGWFMLIICLFASLYTIYKVISGQTIVSEGIGIRTLGTVIFCLGIGIMEEFMYRGLVLGGFLSVFGGNKKTLLVAVAVSAFIFGRAHVISFDFTDPLVGWQSVLKVVQTFMFGVVMAAAFLHSKSFFGITLFHALNDFMYLGLPAILAGESVSGNYTTSGDTAVMALIAYAFLIAFVIYPFIKAVKVLWKEQGPCFGPFIKEQD